MAHQKENLWQKLTNQRWFQILLVALVLLVGWTIYKKAKDKEKEKGSRGDNDKYAKEIVEGSGGSVGPEEAAERVAELREIALLCSKAIWSFQTYLWSTIVTWRLNEDEEAVIDALKRVQNTVEAALVSDMYFEYNNSFSTATITSGKKGLSLKADVEEYLNEHERSQIPFYVRHGLK